MDSADDWNAPLAATFPLPFRVLALSALGVLAWATNLHILAAHNIPAAAVLDLARADHLRLTPARAPRAPCEPVYRLFAALAAWATLCWLAFRVCTRADVLLVDAFKYIPALACIGAFALLITPLDVCQKQERDAFILAVRRCIFAPPNRITPFADVVVADVFTSFAKVLGDFWLSLCMLLPGGSLLRTPTDQAMAGLGWLVLPTLLSLPYALRLRQCLIDYLAPANTSRRPLWNALKYATAFPVIFLSAAQRIVDAESPEDPWHGEHQLFRIWLLSAAVNSLYSFWWDVTNDWGLTVLARAPARKAPERRSIPRPLLLPSLQHQREREQDAVEKGIETSPRASSPWLASVASDAPHPWGLRRTLLYPLAVYPLVVFLNLLLRLTWSAKLSPHLHREGTGEGSGVIFWIEVAEVVRRWMWVFVRVEWEVVKRGEEGASLASASGSGSGSEEFEMVFHAEDEGMT